MADHNFAQKTLQFHLLPEINAKNAENFSSTLGGSA
jgi:hypothetical protein